MAMDGISASLSGVRTAAQAVAVTSNNVANLNTPDFRAKRLDQQDLPQGGVRPAQIQASQDTPVPGGSNVDLATEAVNLKTEGLSYQANLKFLKVQDDLLGAALDMKA
jgi:flagellar hook protein FlgE